jgi:hypothetical protein
VHNSPALPCRNFFGRDMMKANVTDFFSHWRLLIHFIMPNENPSSFGNVPHTSEVFGNVPQRSESFGTIPNPAEIFRTVPKPSEKKEDHILTVREAARLFENAGVARTERSITNWCQPNKSGVPRLDAYFDSNDRKYFITPQSINAAIKEELAKVTRHSEPAEAFGNIPHASEAEKIRRDSSNEMDSAGMEELRLKLRDAEISSRVKDQVIARLEKDNGKFVEQLIGYSRTIGQLENQLLQLDAPKQSSNDTRRVPVSSEREQNPSAIQL